MKNTTLVAFAAVIGGAALWLTPLSALEPLASRIAHTDPTKYRPRRRCMPAPERWHSRHCWTTIAWIPTSCSCTAA